MAVVTVVNIMVGPGVGLVPLVSLGPAFAGLVGGRRRTALTGVVALVLCVGLGTYDGPCRGTAPRRRRDAAAPLSWIREAPGKAGAEMNHGRVMGVENLFLWAEWTVPAAR
jgi:hypothetical protein